MAFNRLMTPPASIRLLIQLRRQIEENQNAPSIAYASVLKLRDGLIEAAVTIFGPDAPETAEARIAVRSPEELRDMAADPALPHVVQPRDKVTRIFRIPPASAPEYYRKMLHSVDEVISSFLLALNRPNL
jgi:hypothetical protein